MEPFTLQSACYYLDQLIYKAGGVDFPSSEENSPMANINRQLYDRCFWAHGMGRSKLAGNTPETSIEVGSYEELLHALECSITIIPLLRDAIKLLNACEAVLSLLKSDA